MNKFLGASVFAILVGSTGAIAQTSPATNPPAGNPPAAERMSPPAGATTPVEKLGVTLTETQAQAWIKKPVFSNDGKNVGEVTAIQRDAAGKVIGMQVGIGGLLGIGETPVKFTTAEFKLETDRVALSLTAAQVKALPKSVQ